MKLSNISVDNSFFNAKNDVIFSAKTGSNAQKSASSFDLEAKNSQKYSPNEQTNSANLIRFFDGKNQVNVNLSSQSIDILKSYFDESDFIELEDGSVGLSGEANAYVEGWFKDIAYTRGYAAADENNDGTVDKDELLNVKGFAAQYFNASFNGDSLNLSNSSNAGTYLKGSDIAQYASKDFFKDTSIEAVLDRTIRSDKDLDGNLTWLESASKGGKLGNALVNDIMNAAYAAVTQKPIAQVSVQYTEVKFSYSSVSYSKGVNVGTSQMSNIQRLFGDRIKELLQKYPEFAAIIQSNENISENTLKQLKEEYNKRAKEFLHSVTGFSDKFIDNRFFNANRLNLQSVERFERFDMEFSMSVLKVDVRA